jgi:hypothetical protein
MGDGFAGWPNVAEMLEGPTRSSEIIDAMLPRLPTFVAVFSVLATPLGSHAATLRVQDATLFQSAVRAAVPGTRIELAPGEYAGGFFFENVRGEKARPIVIAAADPAKPPRIVGGGSGMHFKNPAFVQIENLSFSGAKGNGLNIDNGGKFTPEPRGIVLRGLRVSDVGPRGNSDGIKLSGLVGVRVEKCTIERWGSGSGSAIDMVGCHDGMIVGNVFRHDDALQATGGSGVQVKGGSSDIIIRNNRFEHAGQRAVNIGGSTGLQHFGPPLDQWPPDVPKCEARKVVVEGNTFIGSLAPVCFAGADVATVRFNTIYKPDKWAFRILQETNEPGFVPCHNGVVSDNVIAFESSRWSEGGVNVGARTAPETFRFERNHWFCIDRPEQSRPRLPSMEDGGVYGLDPQFVDEPRLDLRLKAQSPARDKGASALVDR